MGRLAGPSIVTNDIVFYFDVGNLRSFPRDNTWISLFNSYQINNKAVYSDSFIQQDSIKIDQLTINDLNTYSNISIVVSVKSNSSSKGTLFSVYSNNINKQYSSSDVISVSAATGNTVSTNNVSVDYSYANSGIIISSAATGNTISSNTVGVDYSYANSTIITSPAPTGNTVSTSNVIVDYSYANSTIITLPGATGNIAVTSQEIYQDYPEYDVSAYFDNETINTRFKNNDYDLTVNSRYDPSDNDIFTFVFKKSTNDHNVKIYQNRDLLVQDGNISGLSSFGTNFSFLSRNNFGNSVSTPVRLILVYNKELSDSEIKTVATALRKV